MPVVAFEVLATTAPRASRKPAAQAEGSTPFSEMLDKSAKKPAAKDVNKDATKGKSKDAAPHAAPAEDGKHDAKAADSATTKTTTKDGAKGKDGDAKAVSDATVVATDDDTPPTDQDTANDFLTAVANVTGTPVAPADAPKTQAKPDSKAGDESKDDAKTSDAKTTDAKTPDTKTPAVTAVATPPVAVAAPTEAPAATEAAPAAADVAIVAQGIAKAVITTGVTDLKDATQGDAKGDVKADKTDKPQIAVKLDTPPLLTDPLHSAKQPTANPQAVQSQPAQGQAQKPAADATAQPAKPAHHDAPAPDAAVATKPADTTQPVLLVQNNGLTAPQSADQTAVTATPATPAAAPQALPVQGIAIEIAGRALDGKKSFDIRLDPPELGKIHVRLDVDHKGEVTSIITADRSDTFDLLRRDAQSLERALNDAGVKTSSNGLQFSLRDQGQQQQAPQQFANTAHVVVRDDVLDTEITAPLYRSLSGTRAGVDIRV